MSFYRTATRRNFTRLVTRAITFIGFSVSREGNQFAA